MFIAHAGGGYDNLSYTESLDALGRSYENGFRFFELDFMRTSDRQIVCIHDWRNGLLSFEEFNRRKYDKNNPLMRLNNCDVASLGEFLAKHQDASLILDTKEKDAPAVFFEITSRLQSEHGIQTNRIIPQAYSLQETRLYRAAGFPNIIYTIYKARNAEDVSAACDLGGVAITAPIEWILGKRLLSDSKTNPFSALGDRCPVFVHPVSKKEDVARALEKVPQIQGVYTHFLRPQLPTAP
ncbi:hypothetical protein [Microvirga flavescens]|uniref:hypothetical protein n=1 Tax=Microvirga flavescens TaxID=2249811 RepID=UPI001300BDAC|nr:hypothetical protein [Microvirga flavescens]